MMAAVFGRIVVVVAVLALIVSAGTFFLVRGRGFSARATPGPVETSIARAVRQLAIPVDVRRRANPEPATRGGLRAGLEHFADHCAICHGNDGSGTTEMGRGLYPKAPDIRLSATQDLTDGELFYIIQNGVPLTGMPAWGSLSPESERANWHLVQFVRHLPKLTPEEIAAMARLNPKSPAERMQMDPDDFLNGTDVPAPATHKHVGRGK